MTIDDETARPLKESSGRCYKGKARTDSWQELFETKPKEKEGNVNKRDEYQPKRGKLLPMKELCCE